MGNYTLKKLADEPIVITQIPASFSPGVDFPELISEFIPLLDSQPEPVYYVNDLSEYQGNFADVLQITNQAARGVGALLHHPNMREFIAVTSNKLFSLAAKGLNSEVFGNVPVSVFNTYDEALAYCRERIAVG